MSPYRINLRSPTRPDVWPLVVVVDDDLRALTFIEIVLRETFVNPEIVTLRDPRRALAFITYRAPHLVITDLEMPELNGLELVAAVTSNPDLQEVPIIVLTAVGVSEDWDLLRSLGVAHFVRKPVDAEALRQIVLRVLGDTQV